MPDITQESFEACYKCDWRGIRMHTCVWCKQRFCALCIRVLNLEPHIDQLHCKLCTGDSI